ncbi:MAG: protein-arginine deiminase, partial [Myxococcaceae bacterium]|nr:protein-arginine deiminase [Myxococcaceae bacterium]
MATAGGGMATAGGGMATAGGGMATAGGGMATAGGSGTVTPFADLRADSNRDGVIDLTGTTDDAVETVWNTTSGAIVLANMDDDAQTCSTSSAQSDATLAACHDAADTIVNGANDLLDMASLRIMPWPNAPPNSMGIITVTSGPVAAAAGSPRVRFFSETATAGTYTYLDTAMFGFGTNSLQQGINLKMEATNIVRDRNTWDGYVDVTLTVISPYPGGTQTTDTVRFRVAPLMTFSHATPVVQGYATRVRQGNGTDDPDSVDFRTDVQAGLTGAGIAAPLISMITPGGDDQWTQDFFETGYMNMPIANGAFHTIRVAIRSANKEGGGSNPLRTAGKVVFTQMRGPDVAGLQQFQASSSTQSTLDSFGNLETIPPYTHNGTSYPQGRIIRGNIPSYHPDNSFLRMMEGQAVQPPVYVDTSWLLVGHIDETISFLPAATPRGWIMLVNDAALARQMLQDQVTAGNGSATIFPGMQTLNSTGTAWVSAARSINNLLADTVIMSDSAAAAAEVNAQVAIIKAATGLQDSEIVKIPFLHEDVGGGSLAYQPGTVNLFLLNSGHLVSADPHGPIINGVDIFKAQMQGALAPFGYTVHWAEEWYLYHLLAGETHCGTNATRVIPTSKWWESGR